MNLNNFYFFSIPPSIYTKVLFLKRGKNQNQSGNPMNYKK